MSRNQTFVVLPHFNDEGWWKRHPEDVQRDKFYVTVARLDGVKVAYVTKSDARARASSGHSENTSPSEASVLYAVNADGTPDVSLAVIAEGHRGRWYINDYMTHDRSQIYSSRREALSAMGVWKDERDGRRPPRSQNPNYRRQRAGSGSGRPKPQTLRLVFFKEHNSWSFTWGDHVKSYRPTRLAGGPLFFTTREEAVVQAEKAGFSVNRDGICT
jgi:hypothetical protein